MTEKRFEPDEDCHNNQYDYSILNSRYEANIERNEIIEWNKDSCNAQYVGLERIAEKLNFKQMQLEKCHKRYEKLCENNEQLKKDRFICFDCEHSGYIEIGCLCEYTDHWQEYITECEDFKELEE